MRRLIVAVGIVLAMTPHFGRAPAFVALLMTVVGYHDGSNAIDIACLSRIPLSADPSRLQALPVTRPTTTSSTPRRWP